MEELEKGICELCGKKGGNHYIGGCIRYAHPKCADIGMNFLHKFMDWKIFWTRFNADRKRIIREAEKQASLPPKPKEAIK